MRLICRGRGRAPIHFAVQNWQCKNHTQHFDCFAVQKGGPGTNARVHKHTWLTLACFRLLLWLSQRLVLSSLWKKVKAFKVCIGRRFFTRTNARTLTSPHARTLVRITGNAFLQEELFQEYKFTGENEQFRINFSIFMDCLGTHTVHRCGSRSLLLL